MKRLTGTILLTAALLTHVAITVATEESYIFSSTDYTQSPAAVEGSASFVQSGTNTESASPVTSGSFIRTTGFYSIDDTFITY